jgi:hypothetical protein
MRYIIAYTAPQIRIEQSDPVQAVNLSIWDSHRDLNLIYFKMSLNHIYKRCEKKLIYKITLFFVLSSMMSLITVVSMYETNYRCIITKRMQYFIFSLKLLIIAYNYKLLQKS